MKKLTSRQKKRYGIIAAIVLPLFIITFILRLPFYYAVVFYFAAFLISIVFYYPNYIAVWANWNYIRGNEEAALKFLKTAVNRNTKSPAAHHNYALLLMRGGDGRTALETLEKALTLNPKLITEKNIRLAIGSCYWVTGDINAAIETLEDMRNRYEYVNAHVLATLGYMYHLSGDEDKALDLTNKAIEDSPEYAAAWDNLGQIYFSRNDMIKAKDAFETALSHKPGLADSNYYLGLIFENENPEKAREYFEKAANCKITALNTVTKEQIEAKLNK